MDSMPMWVQSLVMSERIMMDFHQHSDCRVPECEFTDGSPAARVGDPLALTINKTPTQIQEPSQRALLLCFIMATSGFDRGKLLNLRWRGRKVQPFRSISAS